MHLPFSSKIKMTRIYLIILFISLNILSAHAQQVSVGVNALDIANVGTLNAEAGISVSQHVFLSASARINPWTFYRGDALKQKQNRHQTYSVGMRWWPWHVYSGWWLASKAQFEEYNRGGFVSRETEEGNAYGMGLGFGYSIMLSDHINMDFGAGAWGGYKVYKVYRCPTCGKVKEEGDKWFLVPNEAILSLIYVF